MVAINPLRSARLSTAHASKNYDIGGDDPEALLYECDKIAFSSRLNKHPINPLDLLSNSLTSNSFI
ncbi:hypothetical protein PIROE2DRAFT_1415 [Piromyces sp. E2]|nr:hypothetical protein PIROE2DRAFT_1415 [Piromyces sp. E2]|eukprot:OUM70533.1 hypothetical protein PIROE2DRAFT_1415 [Piromyces sp. E2]